jgi:hypothetical protein
LRELPGGSELQRYRDRRAVLATMHGKERAIGRPLRAGLGLEIVVPAALDTDRLGTFSGEVERVGSPWDVAIRKARFGMAATGLPFGIAREGSYRPSSFLPGVRGAHELVVFVDDELDLAIVETLVTNDTNFGFIRVRRAEQTLSFLRRVGFPQHGLIVAPNADVAALAAGGARLTGVEKGIRSYTLLEGAVARAAARSADGWAHVETDMRAMHNPTRMRTIRRLAFRLARRLGSPCPVCDTPGFGIAIGDPAALRPLDRRQRHRPGTMLRCGRCGHREIVGGAAGGRPPHQV